jgi:glycosyltransferase involved in cell wall biosynthesis
MPARGAAARAILQHAVLPIELRRLRPEVHHGAAFVVPPAPPCPTVATVHDRLRTRGPGPGGWLRARAKRAVFLAAARRARAVIVPSAATRGEVIAAGVDAGRIRVIAEAPAIDPPADPLAAAAARRRMGVPDRYVLAVGRLEPNKETATLARAFARLVSEHPHGLVLAGPAQVRYPALDRALAMPSLDGKVCRLGPVAPDDLAALYAGADVLAYPSRDESFGLPVLEAMAAGTPVLASTAGGLPEVAGGAALLVAPGDEPALAAALARLLDDGALRADLAARGQARAAGFTWARAARETMEVYRSVGAARGS